MDDKKNILRIYELLEYQARHHPERIAIFGDGPDVTYGELLDSVDRFARALIASGVRRGDRVAMLASPCSEFWISFLACAAIGATWMGLNPRYRDAEYTFLLNGASPKIIFAVSPYEGRVYDEELQSINSPCKQFVTIGDASGASITLDGFLAKADDVSDEEFDGYTSAVDPEDIAALVYTSGTTGEPKGALISHRALMWCAVANAAWLQDGAESVLMGGPINHIGGLSNFCMNVLYFGGKMCFLDRVDLDHALDLIEDHEVRLFGINPTIVAMLFKAAEYRRDRLRSCRIIMTGGAKVSVNMLKEFEPLDARIVSVYGQTETGGVVLASDRDAPLEVASATLGKPVGDAEAKIMDSETLELCEQGKAGELWVRSGGSFSGYLNKDDATRATLTPDGFVRTGDLCIKREDGNYEIVDRLKQMYKSGGYNIYPVEIEDVICRHDKVAGAAVFGVPDEIYSEVGVAYVMPKVGSVLEAEELTKYLRDNLANFKVPKQFFIIDELPLLPNTKVDKQELKRRFLQSS